ncbi:hypothetical protein EXU34_23415, partial [Alteromonas sp. ZYF713]|nr:hypothetical protein [Alteromonas sp. ZYF713]
ANCSALAMSWNEIVDSILKYNGASCACLAGIDGNIWASSPDFKPSQAEILKMIKVATGTEAESFTVNGKKVITVKCGDNELSATGNDYAVDVRVLKTMVIITGNSKPKDIPGVNRLLATAGNAMAEHLSHSGY